MGVVNVKVHSAYSVDIHQTAIYSNHHLFEPSFFLVFSYFFSLLFFFFFFFITFPLSTCLIDFLLFIRCLPSVCCSPCCGSPWCT